jgi:hypothetical protein
VNAIRFPLRPSLTIAAGVLCLAAGAASGQDAGRADQAPATLPTAEAIGACLKAEHSAECLDLLFREALRKHTTAELLQLVARLETTDADLRRECHPVVHAIGRETFLQKGSIHDSFAACDQTCHSGCYHGSVERFLRGDALYAQSGQHPSQFELRQKAVAACDRGTPLRIRYQCLHGLGHAIMFFAAYNLDNALDVCDAMEDEWSRNSCYGGVFMENVVNAAEAKDNFDPADRHAPCSRVDARYRRECYTMQTSHMSAMGLSAASILDECGKAGAYREACARSLGRDLSNEARLGDHRGVAAKCELATGDVRRACVTGVTYALADTTWDGRFAFPFCAALASAADQDECFRFVVQYLALYYEKSSVDIARECASHAPGSARCASAAAQ